MRRIFFPFNANGPTKVTGMSLYLIVAHMLPSSLNCRNRAGYCFQTKHNCLSVLLKTGSTKKIKSIVGCCLFPLFWLIHITIFSLNPVQFFHSVAFVCLFSSPFVSLFSLYNCYMLAFFSYQKPESICSNASFEVVLSCHTFYYWCALLIYFWSSVCFYTVSNSPSERQISCA